MAIGVTRKVYLKPRAVMLAATESDTMNGTPYRSATAVPVIAAEDWNAPNSAHTLSLVISLSARLCAIEGSPR